MYEANKEEALTKGAEAKDSGPHHWKCAIRFYSSPKFYKLECQQEDRMKDTWINAFIWSAFVIALALAAYLFVIQ